VLGRLSLSYNLSPFRGGTIGCQHSRNVEDFLVNQLLQSLVDDR
jgi:hypothetical protein